jgi:tRNA(Ile)-lysidine synthase
MADNEILASVLIHPHPYNVLIPVLVTGIQPPRVRAVNDCSRLDRWSLAPKDLGALDSCDKHRNEGNCGWPPRLTLEALAA